MSERCARCHRALKDPTSKERGFGPVCWSKHVHQKELEKDQGGLFPETELPIPFTGDVILKRGPGGSVLTNISQKIIQHSPAGFEWGYGGSGPADLALNILAMYTDQQTAEELHQVFKWDCIAKLPFEGGIIKGREIKKWIRQHKQIAS